MSNVVAPKDPEQKRPYFYIMRNKEIYGAKAESGKGACFLYQDMGRMINSVKIVGNVEDEKILSLLETVKGFREVVHSIGISVEMNDPNENVKFVFQMYGKKDLYGGGTNLVAELKGDGAEKRIYLSDYEWSEDDNVPGQIQIWMDQPDKLGTINVRFYLNDGFEAPEQEEENEVDLTSLKYQQMIENSLIQTGNNYRLYRAIEKAKRKEEVTLAYIGGSITQGAGATPINTECYAYKSFAKFAKLFGKGNNTRFIKAGVGGTPSELGMIRFERDILRGKEEPDIIVIEFAVNDEGDETKGECYESLVRKALNLPNHPAVILLFAVFADDFNLEERLLPVGKRYDLPMVSVKRAVTPQFYDKESRVLTKNQFFYDIYHPTNVGHTIMADSLIYLCKQVEKEVEEKGICGAEYEEGFFDLPPAIGAGFEKVKLLDRKSHVEKAQINVGNYNYIDNVLQAVEMDQNLDTTREFPYNWMYDGKLVNPVLKESAEVGCFKMDIECKALFLVFKDSGEVDSAKADVFVDGVFVREANPFINGWTHCNPIMIINEKESDFHHVEIKVQQDDIDKKFTILGFGYVD